MTNPLITQAREYELLLRHTYAFTNAPKMADTIAALCTALEAAEKDAKRYRWLRINYDDYLITHGDISNCGIMMESELDEAIDAAMEKAND